MAKIAKYASTCSHGAAQDWFHLKTTYASDIGVQSQLADCPVHCLFEDEVGRVMAASKNPASPGYAIATMIMAAYTKFDSGLAEAKRQDQKKTIPAIHYPILTGVGATAPETFLASLDEATLRGGLIGRRLVVPLNPPTRSGRRCTTGGCTGLKSTPEVAASASPERGNGPPLEIRPRG